MLIHISKNNLKTCEGIYYGIVNESIDAFTDGKKFEKGEKVKIHKVGLDHYIHQIVSLNDDQKVGYVRDFEVTILEPLIDHRAVQPTALLF